MAPKKSFVEYLNNPDGDDDELAAGLQKAIGVENLPEDVALIQETAAQFGDVAGAVAATEAIRDETVTLGQEQVGLAADQVALAANQVMLAADQAASAAAQVPLATAQVALAAAQAGTAAAQAAVAINNATLAQTAVTVAQAARDAALVAGPKYATEAAGRAAVADGVAFMVQGSAEIAAYEYRRVSAGVVSTLIAVYPAKSAVDRIASGDFTFLVSGSRVVSAITPVVVDIQGKILLGYDAIADSLVGLFPSDPISALGKARAQEVLRYTGTGNVVPVLVDLNGKVLLGYDQAADELCGSWPNRLTDQGGPTGSRPALAMGEYTRYFDTDLGVMITGNGQGQWVKFDGTSPIARLMGLHWGQSLNAYKYQRGTPTPISVLLSTLRDILNLGGSPNFAVYGSVITNGSSASATDWTARSLNGAYDGAAMLDISNATQFAAGNYLWNSQDNTAATGNPLDVANSPGPRLRQTAAAIQAGNYAIDWMSLSQGQSDAIWIGADTGRRATYKAACISATNYLRNIIGAITGNYQTLMLICRIARQKQNADPGYQAIREVQTELCTELANCDIGTEEIDSRFARFGSFLGSMLSGSVSITAINSAAGTAVAGGSGVEHPSVPNSNRVQAVGSGTATMNAGISEATAEINNQLFGVLDPTHHYPGINTHQPFDGPGGTQHNTDHGMYMECRREARSVAKKKGANISGVRGPYVSSILSAVGTVVRVRVTHDAGSALNIGAVPQTRAWRVEEAGVAKTVSAIAVAGSFSPGTTDLDITVSAAMASGAAIRAGHGYGAMNNVAWDMMIRDNAPFVMPLQPTCPLLTIDAS